MACKESDCCVLYYSGKRARERANERTNERAREQAGRKVVSSLSLAFPLNDHGRSCNLQAWMCGHWSWSALNRFESLTPIKCAVTASVVCSSTAGDKRRHGRRKGCACRCVQQGRVEQPGQLRAGVSVAPCRCYLIALSFSLLLCDPHWLLSFSLSSCWRCLSIDLLLPTWL